VKASDLERATARAPELRRRVEENLGSPEGFGAALWVTKLPGQESGTDILVDSLRPSTHLPLGKTDAERRRANRKGVLGGPPGSLAATLDGHFTGATSVLVPPILAVTDARVILFRQVPPPVPGGVRGVLHYARLFGEGLTGRQPYDYPVPPLRPVWEAPRPWLLRADTTTNPMVTRLSLLFADGSWLVVESRLRELAEQFVALVGPIPR
jgi:hypothetical protein